MVAYRWYGLAFAVVTAGLLMLAVGILSHQARAAETPSVISQGFTTKSTDLQYGALVSSDPASKDEVKPADTSLATELVGVVAGSSVLEIGTDQQKIQVVTGGISSVLVSDINGEVKKGDRITVSPIAGVGMKTRGGVQVVGVALNDTQRSDTSERTIKDRTGKSQTIHVGRVDALINVAYFPVPDSEKTFLPPFLQQFAATVAGKEVSTIRILVALAIVIVGLSGAGVLLNASVRSSILSIGRNPLSERAVRKSLLGVIGMCLGIIGATLGVVYLVLKL